MEKDKRFFQIKMIYQVLQYYEEVVDRRELTYKVSIVGNRQRHGEVVCVGEESLLYTLYEAKKMDKDFNVEFPQCPVDSGVMEAVKRAYNNGWFQLLPPQEPIISRPTEVIVP